MFSGQFYEKRLSIREKNIKLLLETVAYIAIKERLTCIITLDTVTYIMHCRKYDLLNYKRDSHLHNYNKNYHPHICCSNCHLHMCYRNVYLYNCNRNSHLLNCYRKTHQHTSNRKYHIKTCKNAPDVVTCIIAIESVGCLVNSRNYQLQSWLQKLSLAEMVSVWDYLIYNKEIKRMSKQ